MAPDTWDPAPCQGSIEARGASPYISILDDKTQIRILRQKRGQRSTAAVSSSEEEGKKGGDGGQCQCNVYVSQDKGDRNAPDLDLIKAD